MSVFHCTPTKTSPAHLMEHTVFANVTNRFKGMYIHHLGPFSYLFSDKLCSKGLEPALSQVAHNRQGRLHCLPVLGSNYLQVMKLRNLITK